MAKIKNYKSTQELELNRLRKENLMYYGMYAFIGLTGALMLKMGHNINVGNTEILVEGLSDETFARMFNTTGVGLLATDIVGSITVFNDKERRKRIRELKEELLPYETCICNETEEDIKMNR